MHFLLQNLRLGLTNLMLHKLRSLLTVLGIIFGVFAVIVMLAIGAGNKQTALADIQAMGSTNIILRSVKPPESESTSDRTQLLLTYGITRLVLRRIEQTVSPTELIVPLKQVGGKVTCGRHRATAQAYGTTPDLVRVTSLPVERGRFLTEADEKKLENIAVLGADVAERLFPLNDPLTRSFRIDDQSFKVVGILRRVGHDANDDVYIPMSTAVSRFGDKRVRRASGSFSAEQVELSRLYIRVPSEPFVRSVADQIMLVLDMDRKEADDISMTVPLELLEQAARTARRYNYLLVCIAGISLLVGGIGIMNIMLATVTERIREIGIRRAVGATRHHIVTQFLAETMVLSGLGGLIGVALGLAGVGLLIVAREWITAIEQPYVTAWSVLMSFGVAVSVGVVFGLYPAVKASRQDPIVALRHD